MASAGSRLIALRGPSPDPVRLNLLIMCWLMALLSLGSPEKTSSAEPYQWSLPGGFPEPAIPRANPMSAARVILGRYLFYDKRLSVNGTIACGSCHQQRHAFSDTRKQAVGATGEVHRRNAMALINPAYKQSYGWADPGTSSLETQMHRPMFGRKPLEMGFNREILARLVADPDYAPRFAAAYPGEREFEFSHVINAIASFERTLVSGNSSYDRWVFHDDSSGISEAARRGMALFFSERLGCGNCHGGIGFNSEFVYPGAAPLPVRLHQSGLTKPDDPDQGYYEISGMDTDRGRFKAPTLRNIAVTAPYMHDGRFASLTDVIRHYEVKGESVAGFKTFTLTEEERDCLIGFLNALTDPSFLNNPDLSDPFAANP